MNGAQQAQQKKYEISMYDMHFELYVLISTHDVFTILSSCFFFALSQCTFVAGNSFSPNEMIERIFHGK